MGSSTGNMLVDNAMVFDSLFQQSPMLIATHCEDEATIRANTEGIRRSTVTALRRIASLNSE